MKNVTLSMDDGLLVLGREYARKRGTTLNQLIRDLLAREITESRGEGIAAMLEEAKRLGHRSEGGPLSRDEAHERA